METITAPETPDFYSHIKLINGESIIAGVGMVEENDYGMFLYDPLIVRNITTIQNGGAAIHYHLSPWMTHSFERTFFVGYDSIITHGQLNKDMYNAYTEYTNSKDYLALYLFDEGEYPTPIIDDMSFVDKVEDYKTKLENIFNQTSESDSTDT